MLIRLEVATFLFGVETNTNAHNPQVTAPLVSRLDGGSHLHAPYKSRPDGINIRPTTRRNLHHSSPIAETMQKLTIVLLLSLLLLAASAGADNLIESTCRDSPDRRICETSLRSDPRSLNADTEGLIHIIIDVVKSKFSDSLAYVNQQLKESPPPAKAKALKECARRFGVVLKANVIVAESAIDLGDPKFGEGAMLDSAVEADTCQRAVTADGSAGGKTYKSALIERTKYLHGLSSVAAFMIKVLE